MHVVLPFTDLKNEPTDLPALDGLRDMRLETQLLFNEKVIPLAIYGDWLLVDAPEQPRSIRGKWRPYRGWVKRNALVQNTQKVAGNVVVKLPKANLYTLQGPLTLSFSTSLHASYAVPQGYQIDLPTGEHGLISENSVALKAPLPTDWRQRIVLLGKQLIGLPYLWGGCSTTAGVDCSGLSHLLYRFFGITLPRNAKDQFLRCEQIDGEQLQPGDLLFTADVSNSAKISHVLLSMGEDQLLESPLSGGSVRLIDSQMRFYQSLQQLRSGDQVGGSFLWMGTFKPPQITRE